MTEAADPAVITVHWTNDAQRKLACELFGFGRVTEQRTFYVAVDVARRLQAGALAGSGKTIGELMSDNLKVRSDARLPDGAILCVVERFGASTIVEPHVWPSDRRVPSVADLNAT